MKKGFAFMTRPRTDTRLAGFGLLGSLLARLSVPPISEESSIVIIHPCDGTHSNIGLIITRSNGESGFRSGVRGRSAKSRTVGGEVRVVASCT